VSDLFEHYERLGAERWMFLVDAVLRGGLTSPMLMSSDSMRRKAFAILWARQAAEMDREQIIAKGESWILSAYAKAKRNGNEPQRVLSWRVSRSLADAVMCETPSPDAEEALVTRLARVCRLKTSEDFFEFLLSVFASFDDRTLRMWAGEVEEKKKRAKVPA
jgi:hypothetical protein